MTSTYPGSQTRDQYGEEGSLQRAAPGNIGIALIFHLELAKPKLSNLRQKHTGGQNKKEKMLLFHWTSLIVRETQNVQDATAAK